MTLHTIISRGKPKVVLFKVILQFQDEGEFSWQAEGSPNKLILQCQYENEGVKIDEGLRLYQMQYSPN